MDKDTIIHSGYLKKSPPEGRIWRTWHKRYFVLRSNKTLTYYPNEKDTKPVKDPVDLSHCQSIEANLRHNNKSFKHVFSINTSIRTYYLVADKKEDMEKWVKLLCRECGFEKQDGKPSPDFVHNRLNKSSPKQVHAKSPGQNTLPSPMTPSPPVTCPLSASMPILDTKDRTHSDPPDSSEIIKRATEQYKTATMERRRSTGVVSREHLTLPVRGPDLSRVSECYDPVPPPKASKSNNELGSPQRPLQNMGVNDVDGGYGRLESPPRTPTDNYDIVPPRRPTPSTDYDIVPKPRPASDVYDVVPPHRQSAQANDDDIYDVPPSFRSSDGGNYDIVPPPRPSSQNDQDQVYDYVPKHDPEDMYDALPRIPNSSEEDTYDFPPRELYDIVPPPRPNKSLDTVDCNYDILLPATPESDDIYDIPPTFSARNNQVNNQSPPPRPPKLNNIQAQEIYDIVPPPQSVSSKSPYSSHGQRDNVGQFPENRDSGLYSDDIYDVPPTAKQVTTKDDDIYDIPPKTESDIYDTLPSRETDDIYDIPPVQGAASRPSVDRSCKPPPVNRDVKPADHDYTNLAPPVNRKIKPTVPIHNNSQHSYENMLAPDRRGSFSKSQSLPETFNVPNMQLRNRQEKDSFGMQPYRSEETRCYSFSKEQAKMASGSENYEEMEPRAYNRESGVHSNSSSSEDCDEDCYMAMSSPDQNAKSSKRSASLQYCEVQIIEGQSKCQIPVPKRNAESHYTTINEESTKAFRQTCRQQELSHKK